jgi:DMSO/TMAO reductase YedYZ molybdopterin-dependent catalytic subunit
MSYIRGLVGFALLACLVFAQAPPATLAVQGDVPAPLSLTSDDLAKMPRETATVPAADGSKIVYEGVPLRALLEKAGAPFGKKLRGKVLTTYVLAKAMDGYQVLFTLGELDPDFGNATILVADRRDGKPLGEKQGPFRLVCPNDHEGARSVRMLQTLEVVRLAK